MAFGSVQLVPGVNVERTPTLLRAGYSASALIRWRDSLAQKYGGWVNFYPFSVTGVPRDLHAWEDLDLVKHLAVGTTGVGSQVVIITDGTSNPITPQTLTSNFAPNISTTSGSPNVEIVDPNISNVTVNDAVFFAVPVSIGGLILDGLYQIFEITGTHSYIIQAASNATTTATNPTATNGTTAAGNNTLHFATTPPWIINGMVIADLTTPSAIPAGTTVVSSTGTTVVMSNNAAGAGVGNGDSIVFAGIPVFTTTSGSSDVEVDFSANGVSASDKVVFTTPTSVGGVTIAGQYSVIDTVDANNFHIGVASVATSSATVAMNSGQAQLEYFITLGPPAAGSGFGLGGFGLGGFGTGAAAPSQQTGDPITAVDWTSDNWGQILIECPEGGGIYYWDPTGGFSNMSLISTAPLFNTGIFISTSEQILIAYGSSTHQHIGYQFDPLLVQWSDIANFLQWDPTAEGSQAGNFPIPLGSSINAGAAVANQNLIWTDLDLWAMPYIGPPNVFGFNQVGAGMGAVSGHAVLKLRGGVYWMSQSNFCSYGANGAQVVPCPVWDVVFQNLNTNFLQNVRSMPNTPFNEAGFLFPSAASTSGECDSYVKFNIVDQGAPWDYGIGVLPRSAWTDQSVLGMPIGASPQGIIYQHETGFDAAGSPLMASFTTGMFYLEEGENLVVVDQIMPDFKWGTFSGGQNAQVQLTFNMYYTPTSSPVTYGPFLVTSTSGLISCRMRGRLMAITVSSSDIGSFWRLGSCKYRYTVSGRR